MYVHRQYFMYICFDRHKTILAHSFGSIYSSLFHLQQATYLSMKYYTTIDLRYVRSILIYAT